MEEGYLQIDFKVMYKLRFVAIRLAPSFPLNRRLVDDCRLFVQQAYCFHFSKNSQWIWPDPDGISHPMRMPEMLDEERFTQTTVCLDSSVYSSVDSSLDSSVETLHKRLFAARSISFSTYRKTLSQKLLKQLPRQLISFNTFSTLFNSQVARV